MALPTSAPAGSSSAPRSAQPTPLDGSGALSTGTSWSARRILMAPIAPRTWRAVAFLLGVWPLSILAGIVIVTGLAVGVGLAILVVGLPILAGTLVASSWLARSIRACASAYLDRPRIPDPPPRRSDDGITSWVRTRLSDRIRWRDAGLVGATAGLSVVYFVVTYVVGAVALALLVLPLYAGTVTWTFVLAVPSVLWTVVGVVLAYVWALLNQVLASSLLGTIERLSTDTRSLSDEVERLRASRAGVLTTADEERRRIERDLHDGAQQRLVALSVDLGMARREAKENPDAAGAALEHAQAEVAASLTELRDLVRGVYPQVLTDRGLSAALSAVADRNPVPVSIALDPAVDAALPKPIAAAAYFVVTEALANMAKHSGASSGFVRIDARDGTVTIRIDDNGHGGARLQPDHGLDGLRRRVEALDGTFALTSDNGTTIEVTLPCSS